VRPQLHPVPAERSEPEVGSPASGLRPIRRIRGLPWYAPWVAFLVALAAAATFVVLWQRSQGAQGRAAEVKATATGFLQVLTNFRGDTIDSNVATIRTYAVGDFADQLRTFFNPSTTDALKRAHVVSSGKIRSVFVESVDGDTASVFGVVDESVSNGTGAAAQTEVVRLHLNLIDTGSGWKVSRVDILQSPAGGPLGATP